MPASSPHPAQPDTDTDEEGVWLVRRRRLTVTECPAPLFLLMREFVAIGLDPERIEEEDTEAAIALVQQGRVRCLGWSARAVVARAWGGEL